MVRVTAAAVSLYTKAELANDGRDLGGLSSCVMCMLYVAALGRC